MASSVEHDSNNSSLSIGASTSNAAATVEGKQGRKRLCPHCSDLVSRATYFRHKRIFYNYQSKSWNKSTERLNSANTTTEEVGGADFDLTPPLDNGMREVHL